LENHTSFPYLEEIIVILVTAGLIVPLLHRMRMSPVLAYLVVGGFVGPFGLGVWTEEFPFLGHVVFSDMQGVKVFAELGIIFLLFMIGLELSVERLWGMRRLVFGLGSLQIVITGAVIGLIAWKFGNSAQASIVLGWCLALSSTAVVLQLLNESRRLRTPTGRACFSILLMQDLAVVPILVAVSLFGTATDKSIGDALGLALGKALLCIALIYVAGRLVLRPVLRQVAQAKSSEMFMAAVLLAAIGTASVTAMAGLSMSLGAFLAGLLLAETEYRHKIEVDIEPFKGLLMGIFFMSVGMGIDWRVVAIEPVWIAVSVPGLFILKAAITTSLCLAFGMPRHTAIEAGLMLGQGGEFAFIVVALAVGIGVLQLDVGQFMLIVVSMTMFMTPVVAWSARILSARLEAREHRAFEDRSTDDLEAVEGHVVLAGFGRVGRTLASVLEAEGIPYIALDATPQHVSQAKAEGCPIFYGDASRIDLLRRAHVATAGAVVVTMDDPAAAQRIVTEIRRAWPDMAIYARARDAAHARHLTAAGATFAVCETVEASLQLAGRVLRGFGIEDDVVHRRINERRLSE